MSQFYRYTATEYVEALRSFLGIKKQGFLRENGFTDESRPVTRGRLPKYAQEPIKVLEQKVNERAALAESKDSTLAQRISIARDYKGTSDAELSREMNLSRETVRRWAEGISKPSKTDLLRLAEILEVSPLWLEQGGEEHLAANSPIGVRVGAEAETYKEQLYGLTLKQVGELPEDSDMDYIQTYLEWAVVNNPEMAAIARRAGGRWQVCKTNHVIKHPVVFAPWEPIHEHGLGKRLWSDEVEAMIEEELTQNSTTYAAWKALAKRCEALGLGADAYPRKISLYKRLDHERDRIEKFGVNMNETVKAAIAKSYGAAND